MLAASNVFGTLPGWLTLAALVAVGWAVIRGGGPQAIGILRDANKTLGDRVKELEELVKTQTSKIASLENSRDVSKALPIALKPLTDAVISHEARAQERADEQLQALTALTRAVQHG